MIAITEISPITPMSSDSFAGLKFDWSAERPALKDASLLDANSAIETAPTTSSARILTSDSRPIANSSPSLRPANSNRRAPNNIENSASKTAAVAITLTDTVCPDTALKALPIERNCSAI